MLKHLEERKQVDTRAHLWGKASSPSLWWWPIDGKIDQNMTMIDQGTNAQVMNLNHIFCKLDNLTKFMRKPMNPNFSLERKIWRGIKEIEMRLAYLNIKTIVWVIILTLQMHLVWEACHCFDCVNAESQSFVR